MLTKGTGCAMQITETLSDGLKRAYTIVLPATDIETRRSTRLDSLAKTLRLPGFRPGKVPMPIIRQRFGISVSAEVLEESVSEATRQLMTDRGLRPAMQPQVKVVTDDPVAAPATDIEFTLDFEVLPDIALPDFAAITVTRMRADVPDSAIDEILQNLAKGQRDLVDFTDEELAARGEPAGARDGDVLTVDLVGKIDGEEFEGGSLDDVDVDLGTSQFIPGLAEQMVGMLPGESKAIDVTFPDDYQVPNLAGKAATFEVAAKQLRKPVVPAIDDALADKLAYGTLEEMRDSLRSRAQVDFDRLSRTRLKRQLLDKLAAMVSYPVPSAMVEQEFDQIWRRIESERAAGRMDDEDKDKDEDTLKSEYRGIAERRVRLGLLLGEIGRLNNLTVTEQEMTRALQQELMRYPGQERMMLELFKRYPAAVESLRGPIFEDKVVDFVLELAQVTDETVTPEELMKEPPPSGSATSGAATSEAATQAAAAPSEGESAAPA